MSDKVTGHVTTSDPMGHVAESRKMLNRTLKGYVLMLKNWFASRPALILAACSLLAACGGSPPPEPETAPAAPAAETTAAPAGEAPAAGDHAGAGEHKMPDGSTMPGHAHEGDKAK